jgi:hypothetical protein
MVAAGLVYLFILLTPDYEWTGWEGKVAPGRASQALGIERNQDYVSRNFERRKELGARCLGEQDLGKLTELANEMNLILTQKTPYLDPSLCAAGSHEESQRDVLKPNVEGKACFT